MIIPVIRELATKRTRAELEEAAARYEADRTNVFDVAGKDEGEILTNLLTAAVVRGKMDAGLPLQEALREHTRSIQSFLKKRT